MVRLRFGQGAIARGNRRRVNLVAPRPAAERRRCDEKRVSAGSSTLLMRCAFGHLKRGAMTIETEAQGRAAELLKALADG
jgi:hypothetical protein